MLECPNQNLPAACSKAMKTQVKAFLLFGFWQNCMCHANAAAIPLPNHADISGKACRYPVILLHSMCLMDDNPQTFKHKFCSALNQAGCEVPLPSHPAQNLRGQSIVRRPLKAHCTTTQPGLFVAWCAKIWLG